MKGDHLLCSEFDEILDRKMDPAHGGFLEMRSADDGVHLFHTVDLLNALNGINDAGVTASQHDDKALGGPNAQGLVVWEQISHELFAPLNQEPTRHILELSGSDYLSREDDILRRFTQLSTSTVILTCAAASPTCISSSHLFHDPGDHLRIRGIAGAPQTRWSI